MLELQDVVFSIYVPNSKVALYEYHGWKKEKSHIPTENTQYMEKVCRKHVGIRNTRC